ncbi:sporulation protein YunB [Selenomonadales bacterium OttesenSCG-928-I06]|nr:sporulation protein YunB [Selenomonadales bacterium OttesenSCG-928-I06]
MRFSLKRKRLNLRTPVIIFILLSLSLCLFWYFESRLKPALITIATTRAKIAATQTINEVINNQVAIMVDPNKLVNVTLDERGRVTLIQPNSIEFNRLSAGTTIKLQDALKKLPNDKIYIPLGQILGSRIFAHSGPHIGITILPMGTVDVNISDKFEQAGINQTRHMIYMMIATKMKIVIPLLEENIEINSQILIAEYIIVGDVPSTYLQMPFPLNH